MSLEFCKAGKYRNEILLAAKQEEQLSYLITSDIQETHLTSEYIKAWAERKYQTNDHFLNYLKSIFQDKNFLLFAKFIRKPLPSAKLINTKIRPQLKRVFQAEDQDAKYSVNGVDESDFLPILSVNDFNNQLFDAYFNSHNSIVVCELDSSEVNTPFRYLINITKVKSIDVDRFGNIEKIAYSGEVHINDKDEYGTIYIDDEKYAFYFKDNKLPPLEAPHDLGYCPAHFISDKMFGRYRVVRESLFTYTREELEEYNFLKTLQKMTEPNGLIPVTTMLDLGDNSKSNKPKIDDPQVDGLIKGQQPEVYSDNPPTGSGLLSAGTVYKIPPVDNDGGGFDMDVVKNFIDFKYLPVEPLEFLNRRIAEIENSVVSSLVGDIVNSNEESKNMLQIEKSITVLDNTLTSFGETISNVRANSDGDMLRLRYGSDMVQDVFVTMGTDFMVDSMTLLTDSLTKAPNVIERKSIIKRINQNRYKNNPSQSVRTALLYDILPFISDIDFDKAKASGIVSDINMKLQIRFTYWISMFEAEYGDIVQFYNSLDVSKSEKLILINNILTDLIKKEDENSQFTNQ